MKWRWLIGVPLVLIGGCSGALSILVHIEAREQFLAERKQIDEVLAVHGDRWRSDQRLLSKLPAFAPVVTGRDAGAFMSKHIPFRQKENAKRLDDKIAKAVDSATTKFPQKVMDAAVSSVDLAWMSELSSFDYWELVKSPPLDERPLAHQWMTLPDAAELDRVVRVRLLQGLTGAPGELAKAGRDVDALIRLLVSTEQLVMNMTAVNAMRMSRRAFDYAKENGVDVGDWAPFDVATIDAANRTLLTWTSLTDFRADPKGAIERLQSSELRAGRCAGLQASTLNLLTLLPAGSSFTDDAEEWTPKALELTKDECRLTLAREAWAVRDDDDQRVLVVGTDAMCDVDVNPGECVAISVFSSLPGMKDLITETFTWNAAASFERYNKP